MADFCGTCGTGLGFFSRKRVKQPDGSILVLCKRCAERGATSVVAAPSAAATQAASPSALPGDAIERIVELLVLGFRAEYGIDVSADGLAMKRIRSAAGTAAAELGSGADTEVNLPFLTADATGPKHFTMRIDRRALT